MAGEGGCRVGPWWGGGMRDYCELKWKTKYQDDGEPWRSKWYFIGGAESVLAIIQD